MYDKEIIINLWFVIDEQGFISEVRGRMYAIGGDDKEKLQYLHQYTDTDFMICSSHSLPKNIKTTFQDGTENVIHYNDMKISGGESILFESLFDDMEKSIPSNSLLKFPTNPLTVITPLSKSEYGVLSPDYKETVKNKQG